MVTFEKSKLFGPEDIHILRQIAQPREVAAGVEIFREGDAGDGVYFLKRGSVEISVLVGQNTRHVFSRIEPGDIFGEMAVIEDKPRSASAVAARASAVDFLPRSAVLKLVDSSPRLALALLREVSHRLRAFNVQYLREVLQAERLAIVGRFARSIVHDLKNPLNIIGLTAEIAGMSDSTPQTRAQAVGSIRQQVDRISDLIGEILDFTQGASAELVLPPMNYRLFVDQVLEELRPEVALKGVSIELENEPPVVALFLNPKRLRRALQNLVLNATEAMAGGGKITLRFREAATEVITEIEDTGPGIASEVESQLFQPFVTFGKVHGTGLGLSICRRILEDHKGWISARNEPGRGAVFAFGLPRSNV